MSNAGIPPKQLESNLRRFVLFRVLYAARFYYPVFTILFLDYGLTLEQFAVLNMVWALTIVLAEVPSGALADIIGRKRLVVYAAVLMVIEMAVLLWVPVGESSYLFLAFLVNRICSGLSEAAASGADEALAYDSLKALGRETEWAHLLERTTRLMAVGFFTTMIMGAMAYDVDVVNGTLAFLGLDFALQQETIIKLPVLLTFITACLVLTITLGLREVDTGSAEDSKEDRLTVGGSRGLGQLLEPFRQILVAARWTVGHRFVLFIILAALVLDSVARQFVVLASEYYRVIDIPPAWFGFIGAGMSLIGILNARVSKHLVSYHSPLFNFVLLSAILMLGLLGLTMVIPWFGVLFAIGSIRHDGHGEFSIQLLYQSRSGLGPPCHRTQFQRTGVKPRTGHGEPAVYSANCRNTQWSGPDVARRSGAGNCIRGVIESIPALLSAAVVCESAGYVSSTDKGSTGVHPDFRTRMHKKRLRNVKPDQPGLEDSTPIIVGVGQYSEKNVALEEAQSPMGLAAKASQVALADTGAASQLKPLIDTIAVVRLFTDSSNRPRLSHGFGRADNPPRAVARRLGADPVNAIYGQLGGNTPQKLVNEIAELIVAGDVQVALLTGAEAIRTTQQALRAETRLDWNEHDAGSLNDRGLGEALTTPHEFEYGVGIPIQTYPLFENLVRARRGQSIEQHLAAMGKLLQPFAQIAAANPHAFYGQAWSAEQLATVDQDNRFVCFPYPKLMNARDSVNQSASVIMTSVGMARRLQIEQSKWVFLHGCGEANDRLVTQRTDLGRSPAIRLNSSKALAMADKSQADMDFFDLYSCFPSAVEIACAELGLSADDERELTVTGGLPFFGGPGNNYSMHAIASMVDRLRENPGSFGLVTANGGWLSKHATGIYSTEPWLGTWQRENPAGYQGRINNDDCPPFTEVPVGAGRIETYTICFDRHGPNRGIVVGRLDSSDQRFLANVPTDPQLMLQMVEREAIGLPGSVSQQQGRNTFIPAIG